MKTPEPSFAAISRVVFQPGSVRITVSVFCFKSAISASCFPGLTFSRLIKITDSSDMAYLLFRTHQGRPEGWKRIATQKIFCRAGSAPVIEDRGPQHPGPVDLVVVGQVVE